MEKGSSKARETMGGVGGYWGGGAQRKVAEGDGRCLWLRCLWCWVVAWEVFFLVGVLKTSVFETLGFMF